MMKMWLEASNECKETLVLKFSVKSSWEREKWKSIGKQLSLEAGMGLDYRLGENLSAARKMRKMYRHLDKKEFFCFRWLFW